MEHENFPFDISELMMFIIFSGVHRGVFRVVLCDRQSLSSVALNLSNDDVYHHYVVQRIT